jgi:hypothetical protein
MAQKPDTDLVQNISDAANLREPLSSLSPMRIPKGHSNYTYIKFIPVKALFRYKS